MSTIYVVGGVGRAATAMASYDAALAAANVHNYNLVPVSSVIPATATVEPVDRAPDLGPAGNRLTVVEARMTAERGTDTRVCAGLGWATGPGPGLFYEASGSSEERVRERVETGLREGKSLRDWTFEHEDSLVVSAPVDAPADASAAAEATHTGATDPATDTGSAARFTTAVALAAYGESEPIL